MKPTGNWLDRAIDGVDTIAAVGSAPFLCLVPVAVLHNAPWFSRSTGVIVDEAMRASSMALLLTIPEMLALLAAIVVCATRLGLGGDRPLRSMWLALPGMLIAVLLGVLWLMVLAQPWPGVGRGPGSITPWLLAIAAFPFCAALGVFPLYGLPRLLLRLSGRRRPARAVTVVWLLASTAAGYALMSPAGLPGWFDSFGLGGDSQDGIKVLVLGTIVAVCGGIGVLVHVRAEAPIVPGDREGVG